MVRWSLKSRVVAATVVIVIIFAILLLLVARHYVFTNVKASLQAQQEAQVKLVAEELDDKFEVRAIILRRLAEQLTPMLERSPEELKRFTQQSVVIPEIFNWVFLIRPDGKRLFDTRLTERSADFSDRQYFREILQGASLVISEPLATKVTGAPGVAMAVPIRSDDGQLRAVLAVGLDLKQESFLVALSRNRIGITGTYCLVSSGQSPLYVMHADTAKILQPAKAIGESCGTDKPASPWEFAWPTQPIVARYLLETAGWELVATLPAREAFSPITTARPRVLTAAALALVGAMILMWLVVRHLLIPLERLHQVVQESATDLSAHVALPTSRTDEIGTLATTFSSVMGQLSERTAALLDARKLAEEREERIHAIANHIPEFVAYLDVGERYVFVNKAYEQRFQMPTGEIVGLTPKELWGDEVYVKTLKPHLKLALSGELATFESEVHEKSRYECFEVTYQPAWSRTGDTVLGVHVFARDVTEERLKMQTLKQKTLLDYSTGLLNRKGFDRRLASAMAKTAARAETMALLLVDLDNFKLVNDTYGHAVGDKLLNILATRLRSCVRESDAVARVGGDEFSVILEGITESNVVDRIAEAIVTASSDPFHIEDYQIICGTSVGAALHRPADDNTRNELFLKADTALYAAKHGGKGRFVLFDAPNTAASDSNFGPRVD